MTSLATALLRWFAYSGRSTLPWRRNRTPYRVAVSEFMLQQTQVDRVVPIFERFVVEWPSFETLARASQADVVRAWRGLGYNLRAVRLHRLARVVCERYGGSLPSDQHELQRLPGIGPYTARALAAFAFDADVAALDTNVRRIVHRTQLGLEWPPLANDSELDRRASALLPAGHGYAFNSALMDLGAALCTARAPQCSPCPLRAHCAAAPIDAALLVARASASVRSRPIAFKRSTRFVRGRVVDRLRRLAPQQAVSLLDLYGALATETPHHDRDALETAVAGLVAEGVLERRGARVRLAQ